MNLWLKATIKHVIAVLGGMAAGIAAGVAEAGYNYLTSGAFLLADGQLDFRTLRARLIVGALAGLFGLHVRKPTLLTPAQEAIAATQAAVAAGTSKKEAAAPEVLKVIEARVQNTVAVAAEVAKTVEPTEPSK